MPDAEKTLQLRLEYVTDKPSSKSVKDDLADIQKAFDDATKRAAKLKAELDDLGNRGPAVKKSLSDLTRRLDDDLARNAKSADVFNKKLGEIDFLGRSLEKVGRNFGASWVESLGAALGAGIDLADTLTAIKNLGGLSSAGGAAGGIGGKLAGLGSGAAAFATRPEVVGTAIAVAVVDGMARYFPEQNKALKQKSGGYLEAQTFGKYASVGAYGAGKIFGDDTAKSWFAATAKALGEDIPEATKKATDGLKQTGEAAKVLPSYVQKTIDEIASLGARAGQMAATSLGSSGVSLPTGGMVIGSRSVARRNAAIKAQMAEAEAQKESEDEKLKEIKAAQKAQVQAEIEYQQERKNTIKQFNLEAKQAEQKYRLDMRRMTEDSQRRLTTFARQRDAISFIQEFESGQIERKRAQEDFSLQQQQRKAQLQLELDQASQENAIKQAGYTEALKGAKNFASELSATFNNLAGSGNRGSNINYAPSYTINNRGNGQLAASTINSMVDRRLMGALGGAKYRLGAAR